MPWSRPFTCLEGACHVSITAHRRIRSPDSGPGQPRHSPRSQPLVWQLARQRLPRRPHEDFREQHVVSLDPRHEIQPRLLLRSQQFLLELAVLVEPLRLLLLLEPVCELLLLLVRPPVLLLSDQLHYDRPAHRGGHASHGDCYHASDGGCHRTGDRWLSWSWQRPDASRSSRALIRSLVN